MSEQQHGVKLKLTSAAAWTWALLRAFGRACYAAVDLHIRRDLPVTAAAVTFFAFGALIPMILVIFSVMGHVAGGAVEPKQEMARLLETMLPFGADWTTDEAEHILGKRGLFGVIGLLMFLWMGARVVDVLEIGLNRLWDVPETRGYVRRKLLSFTVLLVAGALLAASLAVTAFASGRPFFWVGPPNLVLSHHAVSLLLGVLLPLAVSTLTFYILYRWLPNCPVRQRSALAGAVLAAALWEVAKIGFTWIVNTTGGYETMYGTLWYVMATLVWLYFSTWIIFLGGAMVHVCEQDAPPPTDEPPHC